MSFSWDNIKDGFSTVAGVYLESERIKSQNRAASTQAETDALINARQDVVQRPNAEPLTPQQLEYLAQQNRIVPGMTNRQMLLLAAALGVAFFVVRSAL
jgi:hypothetical protein